MGLKARDMNQPRTAFVYLCDRKYHEMTQYSLCSLMEAADRPLHIHFFQYDYDLDCPRLEAMASELGHKLFRTPLEPNIASEEFERGVGDGRHLHVTGTAFVKPFVVNRLAKTYDYVVYLDSDLLFFEALDWSQIEGFDEVAAGVLDFANFARPEFYLHCVQNAVPPAYVNSGFLAFNARKWKEVGFLERYLENIRLHLEHCSYFDNCELRDQCPINMTINGDIKILPLDMNVQQWALGTRFWDQATVRHYVGARKFLAPKMHTHDDRERQLLLSLENDLQLGLIDLPMQDFGIAHAMNNLRRQSKITSRSGMLEMYPSARQPETAGVS